MNLSLRGLGGQWKTFDSQARRAFYSQLLDGLRESPGVSSAAAVLLRPFEGTVGWDAQYQLEFEGARYMNRQPPQANFEVVTPGYFQTVGTPLMEGRDFTAHDDGASEQVAIVSNSLAERIRRAGIDPVGSRLRLGRGQGVDWIKIVGVCASARYRSITEAGDDIYLPYRQSAAPTNYIVIRGSRSAGELADLVRHAVAALAPSQAVASVATLGDLIDRNAARHRFNMMMLLLFGACAMLLAAAAVYSVIAQSVDARRREIAIRSILGAAKPRLLRDIAGRTLGAVIAGEVVGLLCVISLGSMAADLFYGVSAGDPMILASAMGFLFAVSIAAAMWPAWAAAGEDPNTAIRLE
jgi:hypothetical protein